MEHKTATTKIYFTNEYSRFKMINGNRQLNESNIKRIMHEVENGNDMLRYYPIQTKEKNGRLEILDGQHRFFICKKLKSPVFYIIVKEDKSMLEVAKINSNVSKWNNEDYINCYVQNNNDNYIKLRDFLDKYRFSLSVSLLLLTTGTPGSEGAYPGLTDQFRAGTFEIKELNKAYELAEQVKRFESFSNHRGRPFVIAIYRILKAGLISIDELVNAYNKRPDMLTEQANFKSYIIKLEEIMNVGKQKRIVIT